MAQTYQTVLKPFFALLLSLLLFQQLALGDELVERSLKSLLASAEAGKISNEDFAEGLLAAAERFPASGESFSLVSSASPLLRQHVAGALLERLKELFQQGRTQDARALVALARSVLPLGSADYQKISKLATLVTFRREITLSDASDELFQAAMGQGGSQAGDLLADLVTRQVERGDWDRQVPIGFDVFTMLAAWWGSDVPDKPVGALLQRLKAKAAEVPSVTKLSEDSLAAIIKSARVDTQAREAAIYLFSTSAERALLAEDPKESAVAFELLLRLRPDPSPENDNLRREMVLSATGDKAKPYAMELLEELKGRDVFSIGQRFTFLRKGFYGAGPKFFLIGFFLFSLLIFALVAVLVYVKVFSLEAKWKRKARSWPSGGMGNVRGGAGSFEGQDDEYSRLLAIFDLDDSATEAQIKKAFRDAVKKHHPDRHGAQGVVRDDQGQLDESFQDVRKVYDRIMEIRGSWFGKN